MHKGYKCLNRSTERIYISHDVVFDESIYPFAENTTPPTQTSSTLFLPLDPVYHNDHMQIYDAALLDTNVPAPSNSRDISGTKSDDSVDGPTVEMVVPCPSPCSVPWSTPTAHTQCHAEGSACNPPDGLISSLPDVVFAEFPSAIINMMQTVVVDPTSVYSPVGDVY
jgi:hypothetical protein